MGRSQNKDVGTKVVNGQKQRQRRNQKFIAHVEAKTNYYRSIGRPKSKNRLLQEYWMGRSKDKLLQEYCMGRSKDKLLQEYCMGRSKKRHNHKIQIHDKDKVMTTKVLHGQKQRQSHDHKSIAWTEAKN